MAKKTNVDKNLLDYIPIKNKEIDWKEKEDEKIQIIIYRDSLFERIVRKLFFTPEKYKIDLDEVGSFIWKHIDGEKNLYEISILLKEHFGEEAEPLYPRLTQYMNILQNNKFINFIK